MIVNNTEKVICIFSSFDAELLRTPILKYANLFNWQLKLFIEMQIVSLWNTHYQSDVNTLNILLIRQEDLVNTHGDAQNKQQSFEKIVNLIKGYLTTIPNLFLVICPSQLELEDNYNLTNYLQHKNVFYHQDDDFSTIKLFDRFNDKLAAIPYTNEYYMLLAKWLFRKSHAYFQPLKKVIVVDCDDTLWQGNCGELQIHEIQITNNHKTLQQFLLAKKSEGYILAICSKNNYADVIDIFNNHRDMLLTLNDFVNIQINWERKSTNITKISHELNLDLKDFIIFDNDIVECEEIQQFLPDVLTINVSISDPMFHKLLHNLWCIDQPLNITAADTIRDEFYKTEKTRTHFKRQFQRYEDFLQWLNLKITISICSNNDLSRIAQLSQRTNQFNFSKHIYDVATLKRLINLSDYSIHIISVADKFGDYGIVGTVIIRYISDVASLIEGFYLSCRALGKQIEHYVMKELMAQLKSKGIESLEIKLIKTERNIPAQEFVSSINQITPTEDTQLISINLNLVDINKIFVNNKPTLAKTAATLPQYPDVKNNTNGAYITIINEACDTVCLNLSSNNSTASITAMTDVSTIKDMLKTIWQETLRLNDIAYDQDFFRLGGTSHLVVVNLSKIIKIFACELSIEDFVTNATINQLATLISLKIQSYTMSHLEQHAGLKKNMLDFILPLWKAEKISGQPVNNIGWYIDITGVIDITLLKNLIITSLLKQPYYGLHLKENDLNTPKIIINKDTKIDIQEHDYTNNPSITAKDIINYTKQCIASKLDITNAPLVILKLFYISNEHTIFAIIVNHMIVDGISINILLNHIFTEYAQATHNHKLGTLLHNFSNYHQNYGLTHTTNQSATIDLFWQIQLKNFAQAQAINNTIMNGYHSAKNEYTVDTLSLIITQQLYQKIQYSAKINNMSVFCLLLTAITIVLSKLFRSNNLLINIPINRRSRTEDNLMGSFIEVMPFFHDLNVELFLIDTFKAIKDAFYTHISNFISHNHITDLYNKQQLHFYEFTQILFSFNHLLDSSNGSNINFKPLYLGQTHSIYPLSITASAYETSLEFLVQYSTTQYDKTIITGLITILEYTLEQITTNRTLHIYNLENIPPQHALYNINSYFYYDKCNIPDVLDTIAANYKLYASNPAIAFGEKNLSYAELELQVINVAGALIEYTNPQDKILVICEPCIELPIIILSILTTGSVYVPVDPITTQLTKIQSIIDDLNPKLILCDRELNNIVTNGIKVTHINTLFSNHTKSSISLTTGSISDAYIMYTSGSTGSPKGVCLTRQGLSNTCLEIKRVIDFKHTDTFLFTTSISFDTSLIEILIPLITGGKLLIIPQMLKTNYSKLITYLDNINFTFMQGTPSFFKLLLHFGWKNSAGCKILCGGEQLNSKLVQQLLPITPVLWNCYGPTETTIWTTITRIKQSNNIIIGSPLKNMICYVLDNNLKPLPVGFIGQLYIGGIGVANGYLNTATDKFVRLPFDTRTMFFASGDYVKYVDNHDISYIGREDKQVKFNGYRISLDEIATAFNKHQYVQDVFLEIHEETLLNQLYAYVKYDISHIDDKDAIVNLKAFLKSYLPEYMIPSNIWLLHHFPLNSNNKIDYLRLRHMSSANGYDNSQQVSCDHSPLLDDKIKLLTNIWADTLGVSQFSIDDNLFDIGGNSLLAAQLLNNILQYFPTVINIIDVYSYPSIKSFAQVLQHRITHSQHLTQPEKSLYSESKVTTKIGVIGISCRFPGINNLTEFWNTIINNQINIQHIDNNQLINMGVDVSNLNHSNYMPYCGLIDNVDYFDAQFFNYTTKEATTTDPQQRIMLELCYEALEDAGINDFSSQRIGIFIGASDSGYMHKIETQQKLMHHQLTETHFLNDKDFLASRIAYKLNLNGPAVSVNTACSTGLSVIIEAYKSLYNNECDIAIAGAISLILPEDAGYIYQSGGIYSSDGYCRPFDEEASGTVPASGAGVVVLTKSEPPFRNKCYAIVASYAINNDGNDKVSYLAPSTSGQITCIKHAYQNSNIPIESVCYIEAHGTGTKIGDPTAIPQINKFCASWASNGKITAIIM